MVPNKSALRCWVGDTPAVEDRNQSPDACTTAVGRSGVWLRLLAVVAARLEGAKDDANGATMGVEGLVKKDEILD